MTIQATRGDNEHIPCVLIKGGVWSLDEKNGQTYSAKETGQTLNTSTVQKIIYEKD